MPISRPLEPIHSGPCSNLLPLPRGAINLCDIMSVSNTALVLTGHPLGHFHVSLAIRGSHGWHEFWFRSEIVNFQIKIVPCIFLKSNVWLTRLSTLTLTKQTTNAKRTTQNWDSSQRKTTGIWNIMEFQKYPFISFTDSRWSKDWKRRCSEADC